MGGAVSADSSTGEISMTTLSWWTRGDRPNLSWAPVRGDGRYVISRHLHYWNVEHWRASNGCMRRQLGFAYKIDETKALAQADYEQQSS
jgi:hypothetical protein